ncbi:hypothetical protein [Rhizobacter sp. OV335]|uniref:hypothetical protein n=1 Tax=Rhizobacter sp. OV335 TaxID=1500264 RepID=UPI0009225BFC|nr:hypothetical protein [Rhizobacter sp. OV335]SHN29764.1 hypothetical protein SAMN02787076_04890 [Rhizobacter sp. OV335]
MRRCCKAWLLCAATLLGSVAAQAGPTAADLKFREFFQLPVGPRGLAPSARLLSLDGQPVRITGYLAHQEASSAAPGIALLTPLPVSLGDEDESFADDLPASTLYLHLAAPLAAQTVPWRPGLVSLTGTLQVGAQREADGRASFVRLVLDPESASVLLESPK